ncbi:histidine phosphatase superfamily [Nemania sp. FL0031]|nr:histidine phosphatase superfamily [Nemania sp. FL0031]
MTPILDIVCVAEGRNDINSHDIPDPGLTPRGEKQCAALRRNYPYTSQVKLIISSPLRRAIDTARAFSPTHSSYSGQTQILLLPELQETSARPSDTGSPLSTLKNEYGTHIDTSKLKSEEWYLKDFETDFFPSLAKVEERAREVRFFLRRRANKLKDGDRIVVVTHGAFAHFLVQDFAGLNVGQGSGVWPNMGFRSFEFVDLKGQDIEAQLREVRYERDPTPAYWLPVCEEQFIMQKSYAVDRLKRHEREARVAIAVKNE